MSPPLQSIRLKVAEEHGAPAKRSCAIHAAVSAWMRRTSGLDQRTGRLLKV
jgi:hypothetical protein